ncbi:glycosyltransferase family 2 protein [Alkalimonas amylolytica]|uniref:Glycosyltransferase involved in cell wall bisynthesis n=1 Tax=Alkalimonas amylolytica TaxID=152573 RepID=A0A1H4FP47_ALKAM|nr:glycosyltransferase family 2 protein [Alkalimonas amylolytica]SEA99096.1 Glycosyltransferase involved in cell wall bisynthesis [Alkalimonas amylolytica]
MKFSIIIPAYQAGATLERCLQSLAAQSISDFEIVLVADDNNDYEPLGSSFGLNIRYLRTATPRSGPSVARNLGLDAAQGDYVCYLDADDCFSDNRLASFYKALQRHKLVGDYPLTFDAHGERIPAYLSEDKSLGLADFLRLNFPVKVAHSNQKNLRFDETVRFAEDTLFNARAICFFNASLYVLADTSYHYYLSPTSLTSQSFKVIEQGYTELLSRVPRIIEASEQQKQLIYQQFWLKRALNKVFFDYVAEFGPCSFPVFSKKLGAQP